MSIDIPRAWEICRSVEREYHHNMCSYNTHGMLCDCDVVYKHAEQLDNTKLYGAGGAVLKTYDEPALTGADPT